MMMMSKGEEEDIANWSDVPIDLLVSIKSRLFLNDSKNFDVVFPNIPNAPVPIPTECPVLHSQWLISIETDGTSHFFHPLYKRETYVMEIPELKHTQVLTAKYGWLLMLMTSDLRSVFFFNPFTKAKIELPPLPEEYISWDGISFSSPPTSSDCIVFGICGFDDSEVSIFYIRRGQQTWTPLYDLQHKPRRYYPSNCNPVFYNGAFYCLSTHGNLGVFDPEVVVDIEDEEDETEEDEDEEDDETEDEEEDGGENDNEEDREYNTEDDEVEENDEDENDIDDEVEDSDEDEDDEVEDSDEDSDEEKVWTVLSKPKSPLKSKSIYECFLVESDGELISVFMTKEGRSISMFSLDRSSMVWDKLNSLGDRMLFISHRGSVSGKSMEKGMGNKIYLMKFSEDNDGVFYSLESGRWHTFGNDDWSNEDVHKLKERDNCTWIEPQSVISSAEELDWLLIPCTIPRI